MVQARAIDRVVPALAEGRTYQVNLTTRLRGPFDGDPEALYHRLRRAQGTGYHAYLDGGRRRIARWPTSWRRRRRTGRRT